MRARVRAAFLVPALAILLAMNNPTSAREPQAPWTEIAWPFLIDQWGTGRAFRCDAADCGTQAELYLRAKVGFCNCSGGVADDEEIDRVGDLELLGAAYSAMAPGQPVAVGDMKGRQRVFAVEGRFAPRRAVLAVALASHCDAVVATVVTDRDVARVEPAAHAFLNSEPVLRWAASNTGLQ